MSQLTQSEFATTVGVSQNTIARWEGGGTPDLQSTDKLITIALELGSSEAKKILEAWKNHHTGETALVSGDATEWLRDLVMIKLPKIFQKCPGVKQEVWEVTQILNRTIEHLEESSSHSLFPDEAITRDFGTYYPNLGMLENKTTIDELRRRGLMGEESSDPNSNAGIPDHNGPSKRKKQK